MEHSYTDKYPLLHEDSENQERSLASKPEGRVDSTLSSLKDPTEAELPGAEMGNDFPPKTGPEDPATPGAHSLQTQKVLGVDLPVKDARIVAPYINTKKSSSVVVHDMNFEKASGFAAHYLKEQNVQEVAMPFPNEKNVADRVAPYLDKQVVSSFPVPYLNSQNGSDVALPKLTKTYALDAHMPYPGTQKTPDGSSTEKQPLMEDFQASLGSFFLELSLQQKDPRTSALGQQIMQENQSVFLFLPSDLHAFTTLLTETTRFCDNYIAGVTETVTRAQNLLQAEMREKTKTQQKLLLRELDTLLHAGCGNLESAKRMKRRVEQLYADFKIDCDDRVCEILVPEDKEKREPETFCKDVLKCVALGLSIPVFIAVLHNLGNAFS